MKTRYSDPLAYFITFTTYGTWLRGDERTYSEKHYHKNHPGHELLYQADLRSLKHEPVIFNEQHRSLVEKTIREVCEYRQWRIIRINVRTNHVHIVVKAMAPPEKVLNDFKSYCTRRLREASMFPCETTIWTEGGSTRWINDEFSLQCACEYVESQ